MLGKVCSQGQKRKGGGASPPRGLIKLMVRWEIPEVIEANLI